MSDTKKVIQNIINNHLPEFIYSDSALIGELVMTFDGGLDINTLGMNENLKEGVLNYISSQTEEPAV